MHTYSKKTNIKNNLNIANDVSHFIMHFMHFVIVTSGEDNNNLDFADMNTVINNREVVFLGKGKNTEETNASQVLENILKTPLLKHMSIDNAMGIIVHFHIAKNFPIKDIADVMEIIYSNVNEDADVIFGTTTGRRMKKNNVEITIIATK